MVPTWAPSVKGPTQSPPRPVIRSIVAADGGKLPTPAHTLGPSGLSAASQGAIPTAVANALLLLAVLSGFGGSKQSLHAQCLLHAADPKNPWALSHGITALGLSFVAADGRLAREVIVGDFLRQGGPSESNPYSFDRYAKDGTPIEPHTNLHLKTLVLAGAPLKSRFATAFGEITLEQLVNGVRRGFRHVPSSEEYWRDVGWTLDLLSRLHRPSKARFENGAGEQVDLDAIFEDALAYLERAQEPLAKGLDQGLPQVEKRKQGIYAHPCGGLHLFQAVASWARFSEVKKRWGKRFSRQVDVLFYRLGSEARQYEEALQKAPAYKLQVLTQMVKFYGHFLETTGRMRAEGSWKPSSQQLQQVRRAKALLDNAVRELEAAGAFSSMERLRSSQPQVYLDLIGDSCHADKGLSLWP